jgi:prepilin-type N-terminal cleavage/methylation domain-containing protein
MKKIQENKGFTLLEVMVSIFVFMIGMVGFVKFQIRSSEMIFDNESAQIAHSLAFNLLEDIDSMDSEALRTMFGGDSVPERSDSTYTSSLTKDRTGSYSPGPYNSFGLADNSATYKFYRRISVQKYASNAIAGSGFYTQKNSPYDLLRQINVYVMWPRRDYPDATCSATNIGDFEEKCQFIKLSLLKPISRETAAAGGDDDGD